MELTEKEIEEILHQYIYLGTEYDNTGSVKPCIAGVPRAARSIHEQMKEGVVWERTSVVAHLNSFSGYHGPATELGDGDEWFAIFPGWILEEHLEYTVTVKKI